MQKQSVPKVGQRIYVPTRLSIDHGEDDVLGGLATIDKVTKSISAGKETFFVSVKEWPGEFARSLNYDWLMERQEDLKREFGRRRARPDPDWGGDSNKQCTSTYTSTSGRIRTTVFCTKRDGHGGEFHRGAGAQWDRRGNRIVPVTEPLPRR